MINKVLELIMNGTYIRLSTLLKNGKKDLTDGLVKGKKIRYSYQSIGIIFTPKKATN
jgi:hypothetical protein